MFTSVIATASMTCSLGHGLHLTAVPRSTQPCTPLGSLNRVPASVVIVCGNVTSAGWQVTVCDPMWHVSSRSGEAGLLTNGESLCYISYFFIAPHPLTQHDTASRLKN